MLLITGTLTTVRKGMPRGLSSRQHCKPSDIKARRGPGQTQGRVTNGCWSGKATKTGDPEQWVTDCKGLGGEAGENCESIPGGADPCDHWFPARQTYSDSLWVWLTGTQADSSWLMVTCKHCSMEDVQHGHKTLMWQRTSMLTLLSHMCHHLIFSSSQPHVLTSRNS